MLPPLRVLELVLARIALLVVYGKTGGKIFEPTPRLDSTPSVGGQIRKKNGKSQPWNRAARVTFKITYQQLRFTAIPKGNKYSWPFFVALIHESDNVLFWQIQRTGRGQELEIR